MIKFFRKVRKKMADDNKPIKYLRYAIGEIFLVVIGILIALQINDWSEQQKKNNSEREILEGLQGEFLFNLKFINYSIKNNEEIAKGCFELTKMIRSNSLEKQSKRLDSLLVQVSDFGSFDAARGVTDEIISSGKLNIIKNDSLRTLITRWTGSLEDAKEDLEFRFENYHRNLVPYLSKNFPLANGDLTTKIKNQLTNDFIPIYSERSPFKADFKHLNLMEFENVVWNHKHNNDYVIFTDYGLKKEISAILKILSNEIKK